ncbi:MAG TPA: patatin-like phospholipase family protein [Streptosporangiaceae bacterium]|nr:patatin-like phospholipase family protein [Streptosporangiaceae bacterium]
MAAATDGGEQQRRVVIACQGGGSHTAFTAGVLKRLLGADELTGYEVVGLSGTSGGAVCALLAWYALLDGDPVRAGHLLDQFWADNSARGPVEMLVNNLILWAMAWQDFGVVPPAVSPYHSPASVMGADQFCQMLGRQVDFDRIEADSAGEHPVLLIGAVDVLSGQFRTFNSRRDRITAGTVLASAAIPNLFRAVRLEDGTYWDGLFSQNPPVRELLDAEPDELWVIQINPQQRDTEPATLAEIADRRNELAGNLSLYQELAFIEKIDQLLEAGLLSQGGKYKQVVVRVIELSRSSLPRAHAASKLNRDPLFIQNLMSHGEQQAGEFLAALAFERAWADKDVAAVMGLFAEDPELVSAPPFTGQGSHRGSGQARQFVQKQLSAGVRVDLTHKLVARERVTWMLRTRDDRAGTDLHGQAEAEFRGDKVISLRLGPLPPSP